MSWPTASSGVPTDVTGDGVRAAACPLGLVDVNRRVGAATVCAVDATWTALKLTIRKELR